MRTEAGYRPNHRPLPTIQDVLDYQTGLSINLGGTLSLSYTWALISLTVSPGINGSYATTSGTVMMRDITGDGLPDHVMKYPGERVLRVKTNAPGGSLDVEYTP